MDIREQLIAYLEGTLAPDQRVKVTRHLAQSATWQREYQAVRQTQAELRREMPLFGEPAPDRLKALLPSILEQATRPKRRPLLTTNFQSMILVGSMAVLLVLLPFFLHNSAVDAAGAWPHNVPLQTSTAVVQDSTLEAESVLLVANETTERDELTSILWSASPAPMPGATLEPSREARYR
ncbi:MAG: hypothetical protein H6673_04250 [Anaerolineales bacterium]|nr:hypothetical protein [Anaerolineales bacterium]